MKHPAPSNHITVRVVLHNGSDEQVYDVRAVIHVDGFDDGLVEVDIFPPHAKDMRPTSTNMTIHKGLEETRGVPDRREAKIDLTFRDAATRTWHRHPDGRLELRS